VIGTNKPDSVETVEMLLEDANASKVYSPTQTDPEAINHLLRERGVRVVTYADWQILDTLEQQHGADINRPRLKFSRVQDMLAALTEAKSANPAGD
jgi:ferredoxin--NADP+ reductase